MRKNRKIDVVKESGKLRWEKKGRRVGEREKVRLEKKMDRHGWERGN